MAAFEILNPVTLFVQEVGSHLDGQLGNDLGSAFLTRFLADDAQYGERQRLDRAYGAETRATRARLIQAGAPPSTRYQFERLGYFCVDSKDSSPEAPVFNRTVTLRDTWAKILKAQKKKG